MISHQVLHLGWSSLCFTALVGLIDSQMLQTVLCFVLLPGCSDAWQTSRLHARSGRRKDSCSVKAPSCAIDRTVKSNDTLSHTSLFPMFNLILQICSVTTMVLPVNTRAPLLAQNALGACLDPLTILSGNKRQNHCHSSSFAHQVCAN